MYPPAPPMSDRDPSSSDGSAMHGGYKSWRMLCVFRIRDSEASANAGEPSRWNMRSQRPLFWGAGEM